MTTRAVLVEETESFRRLVMLDRLGHDAGHVHIGLGVARTVAAAEALARHALHRAARTGPFAAVVSFGAGADLLLADRAPTRPGPAGIVPVAVAERRSGIDQLKLRKILAAAGTANRTTTDPVTTNRAATDPVTTDRAATDHAATDHVATDHVATDRAATDHAATDHVATDHVATDRAATDHAATDHVAT
ncbi:hypothetical protein, partial [Kribbella hippodromi]|uniref:hypothetical protein n=1 Tax=Kribbella hippodromi TaxID=434347 RepID=UPI003CD060BB